MPYLSEFDNISSSEDSLLKAHRLIRLGSYEDAFTILEAIENPEYYQEDLGYIYYLKGLLYFVLGQMQDSYFFHQKAHDVFLDRDCTEWLANNAASWFRIPFGSGNVGECERLLNVVKQFEGRDKSTDVRGLLHHGLLTTLRGNINLGLKSVLAAQELAQSTGLDGEFALCSVYKCLLGMHANKSNIALEGAEEAQNRFLNDATYVYYHTFSKIIFVESSLMLLNAESVPFQKRKKYFHRIDRLMDESEAEAMKSRFLKGIWLRQKAELLIHSSEELEASNEYKSRSELAGAKEIPYNRHAFYRIDCLTNGKDLAVQPIYWQNKEANAAIYAFLEEFSEADSDWLNGHQTDSALSDILLRSLARCLKTEDVKIVEDRHSPSFDIQYQCGNLEHEKPISWAQRIDSICVRLDNQKVLQIKGSGRNELSERDLSVIIKAIARFIYLAELNKEYQISLKKAHEEALKNQTLVAAAHISQNLVHDLRVPLGTFESILAFDENQMHLVKDRIRPSLHRIYAMIDALRYTDLESFVRPSPVSLDLTASIESLKFRAEQQAISLNLESKVNSKVNIDLIKFERACCNLVGNSIDAAKSRINVEVYMKDKDLHLQVSDDGPGVPPEIMSMIFERGTTYGKKGGTGLGLSYVRQILRGHGGDVSYKRVDDMTIFHCVIPDAKVSEDLSFQSQKSPKSKHQTTRNVGLVLQSAASRREILNRLRIMTIDRIVWHEGFDHRFDFIITDDPLIAERCLEAGVSVAQFQPDTPVSETIRRSLIRLGIPH